MTRRIAAGRPVNIRTKRVTTRLFCRPGVETLNAYELKAINSLFAWVAVEQGAAPERVQGVTAQRFGVQDVTALPRRDYDEVVRFLIGLRIDEMRH